jgi:hypothetical protein
MASGREAGLRSTRLSCTVSGPSVPPPRDGIDFHAVFTAEFELLPEDAELFGALLARRSRMVHALQNFQALGRNCLSFSYAPSSSFTAMFVPFDRETLRMALQEMEHGQHGATPEFRDFLRNRPRTDGWGLHVAFSSTKLKRLHTNTRNIDGQILTDGVRVIFPLRTPQASAVKKACSTKSGFTRSDAGQAALVHGTLGDGDDVAMYDIACGLSSAGARASNQPPCDGKDAVCCFKCLKKNTEKIAKAEKDRIAANAKAQAAAEAKAGEEAEVVKRL